jgi:hypothetical protein
VKNIFAGSHTGDALIRELFLSVGKCQLIPIVLFYIKKSVAVHILLFGGFIGYGLKLEPYCPSKASKGDLVSRPSNSRVNNPMILPFQSALSKGSSGNKKKVQYCSSLACLALFFCQIIF